MEKTKTSWISRLEILLGFSETVVPLLILVIGIGMVSGLPEASSNTLFASEQQAESFFAGYNVKYQPTTPVIIAEKNCQQCDQLRESLVRQNIAYTELTMEEAPAAAQLVGRIREHTGDTHLPKVLVGTHLVPTNPVAVLAAARAAMLH